jgi:hypothetical protein
MPKILRHGTSGFTFHLKEGVLRIFIALKNPSLWTGSNPRPLGPMASTLTTTPPRRLICVWRSVYASFLNKAEVAMSYRIWEILNWTGKNLSKPDYTSLWHPLSLLSPESRFLYHFFSPFPPCFLFLDCFSDCYVSNKDPVVWNEWETCLRTIVIDKWGRIPGEVVIERFKLPVRFWDLPGRARTT